MDLLLFGGAWVVWDSAGHHSSLTTHICQVEFTMLGFYWPCDPSPCVIYLAHFSPLILPWLRMKVNSFWLCQCQCTHKKVLFTLDDLEESVSLYGCHNRFNTFFFSFFFLSNNFLSPACFFAIGPSPASLEVHAFSSVGLKI